MTLQRIENERQLVTMSYRDSLTGLYNRNRYNEDVRALEKLARPFGAIFLDANGMKEINDRGGHAEGDRLLQMCSETMRRVLGGAARIYRVGGDEFVATGGHRRGGFRALVDGLQRAFAETPSCNVAIGAQWTARSDEIDRALFDADEAMYRDKRRFYRSKYTSDLAGARHPRSGRYHEAGSGAPSESFERGASFMNALGFGFARQLMDEDFSVIASNDLYAALVGDDAASRRAVGALASRAFEAGERSFCGPVRVSRRGEPAWVEVIRHVRRGSGGGHAGGVRGVHRPRGRARHHRRGGVGRLQVLEQPPQRRAQAERDLLHEVDGGVAVAGLHLGEVRPAHARHERKLLLRQIVLLAKRPERCPTFFLVV